MRRAIRWVWVNLWFVVVHVLAAMGVFFWVSHVGLPAHETQGERQLVNIERLTRLETQMDDRFRGADHRAWAAELKRLNPSLKLPE